MPAASSATNVLLDPVWCEENPITIQVLGVCSALAVTRSLSKPLLRCRLCVMTVLLGSSVAISAILRNDVPRSVRLIIEITIIATLVIVVDQVLQAFFPELSSRAFRLRGS